MNIRLSQWQRILTACVYLLFLWVLYTWTISHIPPSGEHALFWFYSGALMIILGAYVVELFFTTPADAMVNGLALLIALTSLSQPDRQLLIGYQALLYYGYAVMVVAGLSIALKDTRRPAVKRIAHISYKIAEFAGRSRVMFSLVYLLSSYSFFARPETIGLYVSMLALWICITFLDVVGNFINEATKAFRSLRRGLPDELGRAIGCDNPLQYTVEVDHTTYRGPEIAFGDLVAVETKTNIGSLGMVLSRKQLLGKSWLSVYLLTTDDAGVITMDIRSKKFTDNPQSVFASENKVFPVDLEGDLEPQDRDRVAQNPLYRYRNSFVGYVTKGSNIDTVSFVVLQDRDTANREVSEGTILKTAIYGEDALYQVVNGDTREEHLEALNSHGYTVGIARKLGQYNKADRELETRKWMPSIYSPVFFGFDGALTAARTAAIAQAAIGRLPETDLEIPIKDFNTLVTHNTGILGILGIGKSCLTYELISKVFANSNAKVICLDITNEYQQELPQYGHVVTALDDGVINTVIQATYETVNKDRNKGGNHGDFRREIQQGLTQFFGNAQQRILVINPEAFNVSVQTNDPKPKKVGPGPNDWQDQAPMRDMTVAEITRIVSEVVLEICKSQGRSNDARCLLVYEEAHSLIPEWNSASNDGDEKASNGTAKVILQGRKYGLGCFVVTQRTANVSKSILNQCNTMFAFRVFDDTGKAFLENYISGDYARTLPTLEERHAVVTGKGLALKQPVIIQLNDRAEFRTVAAGH